MTSTEYQKKLKKACKSLGTYNKSFDLVISKLADILAEYDEAAEDFEQTGAERFIEYTNKSGAVNLVPHPDLVIMRQCRTDMLPYLKELGLTPVGVKKVGDASRQNTQLSMLDAIKSLGG